LISNEFNFLIIFVSNFLKANRVGWCITSVILIGMVSSFISSIIYAVFIDKTGLKSLFKPAKTWGPLKDEHKKKATHLDHLKEYHNESEVQVTISTSTASS
jgi:hypothetical protein